jgi:hypothetical protein
MRENGVPGFPDPNPDGGFSINSNELGVSTDSKQYKQAETTCAPLMPESSADQKQQDYQAFLKYARCMREKGISDYPDPPVPGDGPNSQGGGPSSNQGGQIAPTSPQFQAAHEACKNLLPDGGAGSGVSGKP